MDNSFRVRKPRAPAVELNLGTMDSIHQQIITNIKSESQQSKDTLEQKKLELELQLSELNLNSNPQDFIRMTKLQEDLKTIKSRIENTDPLKDYYIKYSDLMMKYYSSSSSQPVVNSSETNTFMKYLNTSQTQGTSKKSILDDYISRLKVSSGEVSEPKQVVTEQCERCNVVREELSEEGILVCPECGSEEHVLVVSDYPSFRDTPKERNNYAYKKINHLNEILNQFQAKESTIIPQEVFDDVVLELKKRRIQNIASLTEKDMREILKKINKSKYYEHATHILSRLNGNPPPTITPEIEEKIRSMFQEIQAPFLMYCPNDRTNFLSYSFILYKFFELLELDEYMVYFPLLKSRDRLISHDQIWKQICDYLKWEFIQSV